MRLTIIRHDGQVYVDGSTIQSIDMSRLSENISAIQWDGTSGHIEFCEVDGIKPNNEIINSITPYQWFIDEWVRLNDIQNQPIPISAEQNKNEAKFKLMETDYIYLSDINILNKAEFDVYRASIREIFFNPPEGVIDWPIIPVPQWI